MLLLLFAQGLFTPRRDSPGQLSKGPNQFEMFLI
jgi:hypothetical protein